MGKSRKKKSANIPEGETKSDRFVRVVKPRVTKAIKAIRVIGYCAGAAYDYDAIQVEQITDALDNEIAKLKDTFVAKRKGKLEAEFDFD